MGVGVELMRARQEAGLSREQLAARTRIQLAKIEALEQEAFDRLPTGGYLDGLVRAFAREVGADGQALVRQLADERESAAIATPLSPPAFGGAWSGAPASLPEPLPEQAPPTFRPDVVDTADDLSASEPEPEVSAGEFDLTGEREDPGPPYVPPMFVTADAPASASPQRSRFTSGVLLLLVSLVALAGWGLYWYERARPFQSSQPAPPREQARRSSPPSATTPVTTDDATASSGMPDAAGPPRASNSATQPATPPPGRSPASGSGAPASATRAPAQAASAPRAAAPAIPGAPEAPSARVPSAPAAPAALAPEHPSTPAPEPPGTPALPAPEHPSASAPLAPVLLTGPWSVSTFVESSGYQNFEGLRLGYRVTFDQQEGRVVGVGEKVSENGAALASARRTPIRLEGAFDGARLRLEFEEQGTRRPSRGTMMLHVEGDGVLRGRFSSDAARSSGRVEAVRQP